MKEQLTEVIARLKFYLREDHRDWTLCYQTSSTTWKGELTHNFIIGLHEPTKDTQGLVLRVCVSDSIEDRIVTKFLEEYEKFKENNLPSYVMVPAKM
jgi:hypothetical protein